MGRKNKNNKAGVLSEDLPGYAEVNQRLKEERNEEEASPPVQQPKRVLTLHEARQLPLPTRFGRSPQFFRGSDLVRSQQPPSRNTNPDNQHSAYATRTQGDGE